MSIVRIISVAALALTSAATSVSAGGLERGSADLSTLYDDELVSIGTSLRFIRPSREFETVTPVAGAPGPLLPAANVGMSGNFSNGYLLPSFSARIGHSDYGACAATYVTPLGASVDYSGFLAGSAPDGTITQDFLAHEYGLTCAARMNVGPGRLHFIGGVFLQSLEFEHLQRLSPTSTATISGADKSAFGYRVGLAYDIPEYGLRGEVLYRSAVDHNLAGNIVGAAPVAIPVFLNGRMPQSVEASFRSGVAPGWLAFGSVKWTDWSVLGRLNLMNAVTNTPLRAYVFNYRDGWTVTGGVAHVFAENLIGTAALVWDRGVGSGADLQSDVWTLGLGATYRFGNNGQLTAGGAISYLTAASQSVAKGAPFNATAGHDLTYTLNLSAKFSF